jgi:hypothetical protein
MKKIRTAFLIASLLLTTSCITKALWGHKSYDEEIKQFYVGADGRYVVLVAPEYHYIFTDNSGILREILSLKQQGILTLSQKTFLNVDENNNIAGDVILEGPHDLLPQEDMIKLQLLGLSPDKNNNIVIRMSLTGRRYSARYLNQSQSSNLNNSYRIKVYYTDDIGFAEGVGKAAITPVAVTLDAVLLIGKVAIYPLTLPYRQYGL